jgi:hypothetical protein
MFVLPDKLTARIQDSKTVETHAALRELRRGARTPFLQDVSEVSQAPAQAGDRSGVSHRSQNNTFPGKVRETSESAYLTDTKRPIACLILESRLAYPAVTSLRLRAGSDR